MAQRPVSDEIAGALGLFFHGGVGSSHSALTGVFAMSGYSELDSYRPGDIGAPNKETRVQTVIRAAMRRPNRARELVDGLLAILGVAGEFQQQGSEAQAHILGVRSRWDARQIRLG